MKKMFSLRALPFSLFLTCAVPGASALEPFPLDDVVREAQRRLTTGKIEETGLTRTDYLTTIEGIVHYFRHFQQADGRIIDPFEKREIQYSTPCYAWAATVLAVSGHDMELLESAIVAFEASLEQLAEGTAADGHGDFFIFPVMLAYEQLRDRVPPNHRKRWEEMLGRIDPLRAYRDVAGETRPVVHNWNVTALVGEFLRDRMGFSDGAFVKQHLPLQLGHFTAEGLYRDPDEPMAYDHFARFHLAVMLARGYDGEHESRLAELLDRAAWTSMLMQSPLGELPSGGRSAQHQWNEAQQCVTFEIWAARKLEEDDETAARAFKRAAHLALESVRRWVRPSGDLWVVKNLFDPAARHGFEHYSFHSQYNLLAASMLATAWHFADEDIQEGPAPADVGGFVFELPEFRKIFANAGGLYLQLETPGNPMYESTGLVRIQRTGVHPLVGPGTSPAARDGALAIGLAWREPDGWKALASQTTDTIESVELDVHRATPQRAQFAVRYRFRSVEETPPPVRVITELYEVVPTQLRVVAEFDGDARQLAVRFPALVFDGRHATRLLIEERGAMVQLRDSRQIIFVEQPGTARMRRSGFWLPTRNGYVEMVEAQTTARRMIYRLRPERLREPSL